MADFITNAEGNFFVQEERAVEFEWLTCTGVGDIDIPAGDVTTVTRPDPMRSGKFKIDGFITGMPAAGTYSLSKPLARVANWLLERTCDFSGRVNWVCRGSRQDPANYEVAVVMPDSTPGRKRIPLPVLKEAGNEARLDTELDIAFQEMIILYQLSIAQEVVTNTNDAYTVFFLPEQCEDRCGPGHGLGEYGVIGLDNNDDLGYIYGYDTVKITTDTWSTIAATAAEAFVYGGDVRAIFCVENVSGISIIAFRGSTVIGHPAECAVSTDDGVTWTNYNIGAIHGQFVYAYALNGANIFVTMNDGYIYRSIDMGVNWTVVDDSTATAATPAYGIAFHDDNLGYVVGDSEEFAYTEDGGASWTGRDGPTAVGDQDLLCLALNDKGHLFTGTNAGEMWTSVDEGVTWTQLLDFGAGSIDWVQFDAENRYIGAFVYNDAADLGSLYRTENGGATWRLINTMPANSGLNGGHVVDANHIVVVGNAHGGTTFIARTAPAA